MSTTVKRVLPSNLTTRAAAALLVIGLVALGLAAFGYGSEVVGSICGDGWISESTGSGTCSGHDGVRQAREVDSFVGLEPVSWVETTRWPLLVLGILSATLGGVGLVMSRTGRSAVGGSLTSDEPGTFQELHVRVVETNGARKTTVTAPDGSKTSAPFAFDALSDRGTERLHELLDNQRNPRFGSKQNQAVEAFGDDLFGAIFSGALEAVYRRSFNAARKQDLGLRILLELDTATADLPWEYMHDKERASFLALSTETSVVRRLTVSDETRPQTPIETVRMLVMGAAPAGSTRIDVAGERERIETALEPSVVAGRALVEFVTGGTMDDLRSHLESFEPHVLHFVGHGKWDNEVDDGELLFESAGGGPAPVTGRELGVLLVRSGLRLVLLNSCQAARSSQNDRFAGIATSLVAQGVPAVLAMQFPIEDQVAAAFGSTFLRHLVSSRSIDASLNKALHAVFTTERRVEWGTPVLTTRVPVDRVLPVSGDNHER